MNKQATFFAFAGLVLVALIGYIVLLVLGVDTGDYVSQLVILLGLVATFAGTSATLGKIEKNTNGTLSARDAKIEQHEATIADLSAQLATLAAEHAAATGTVPTITPEE